MKRKFIDEPVPAPAFVTEGIKEYKDNPDPFNAAALYLDVLEQLVDDYENHPSPDAHDALKRQLADYEAFAIRMGVKPYITEKKE